MQHCVLYWILLCGTDVENSGALKVYNEIIKGYYPCSEANEN